MAWPPVRRMVSRGERGTSGTNAYLVRQYGSLQRLPQFLDPLRVMPETDLAPTVKRGGWSRSGRPRCTSKQERDFSERRDTMGLESGG